jgi:hypothetical protein
MAIVVKSGGNPAPALVGAYAGGMGKRRAEDERQQAALIAAKEAQQRSIAAQQQESALSRTFASDQADANREFTLGRDEAGYLQADATQQTAADLREQAAVSDQLRRREDVEYTYTTEQKRKDAQYREALASVQTDEDMRPSEKLAAIQQLEAIRRNIKPIANWTQKQITPEERLKTSTTTLPNGAVIGFKPDGSPFKLMDSPESKQAESKAKDREAALKQATDELNDASSKGDGTRPTMDAKITRAMEILKEMREFQRLDEGGQSTEGAAGAEQPIPEEENPFSTVAPEAKDAGQVVTKMLKNGQKVRVRRLPNGKWEQVN